jgi:hypothetical protein
MTQHNNVDEAKKEFLRSKNYWANEEYFEKQYCKKCKFVESSCYSDKDHCGLDISIEDCKEQGAFEPAPNLSGVPKLAVVILSIALIAMLIPYSSSIKKMN